MPGFSWFSLIDCGVVSALLKDKQSLTMEDLLCFVFYKLVIFLMIMPLGIKANY